MTPSKSKPQPNKRLSLLLLGGLSVWLIALLAVSVGFQSQYIKPFATSPTFLQADKTQTWFNTLQEHLPQKNTKHRLIQFWQPDCLCNRFAKEHALNALNTSLIHGIEHITIIPIAHSEQITELQALNPNTQIVAFDPHMFPEWPKSPAVLLEGTDQVVQYFGPLGFGAFCTQGNTRLIERQIQNIHDSRVQPFFNVIGSGCFCG